MDNPGQDALPAKGPCLLVDDDSWPAEIADLKNGFAGLLNVYRVMAHHPALLRAWAPLRQHVVKDCALGPEVSELVILRCAHRMGSDYEWNHHVSRARALSMSDKRINALRGQPTGLDGLIVRAVDSLFDERKLPPSLEAELADRLGRHGVFDLMATVGFYSVLGFILMTYNVQLDDQIAKEMADRPLAQEPI